MKYCSSCKAIVCDEVNTCPKCEKPLSDLVDESIVSVAIIKGRVISLLEPALKDAGIPCSFKNKEGEIYNSFNTKVSAESDFDVLVPFELYSRAFNICLGMDIVKEEDRLVEDTEAKTSEPLETYDETFERVNGVKKRTWTIIWVVLFILLACFAIWGVDAIAYFIKGSCVGENPATTTTEAVKGFISLL